MKRFNIVIPKDDGGMEVYAMKEWLRQNPQPLPAGLDATASTSHQLRNALRRLGWSPSSVQWDWFIQPARCAVARESGLIRKRVETRAVNRAKARSQTPPFQGGPSVRGKAVASRPR